MARTIGTTLTLTLNNNDYERIDIKKIREIDDDMHELALNYLSGRSRRVKLNDDERSRLTIARNEVIDFLQRKDVVDAYFQAEEKFRSEIDELQVKDVPDILATANVDRVLKLMSASLSELRAMKVLKEGESVDDMTRAAAKMALQGVSTTSRRSVYWLLALDAYGSVNPAKPSARDRVLEKLNAATDKIVAVHERHEYELYVWAQKVIDDRWTADESDYEIRRRRDKAMPGRKRGLFDGLRLVLESMSGEAPKPPSREAQRDLAGEGYQFWSKVAEADKKLRKKGSAVGKPADASV